MDSDTGTAPVSKKALWAGRIISGLVGLLLLVSGVAKFMKPIEVVDGFLRLGYPEKLSIVIGIIEVACTIVYIIPRTAILGAILLTAYFGGATATHVRIGDPFYTTVSFGVIVWLGLYLRDARLRTLVPLRSSKPNE